MRTLSHQQARRAYDRIGALQDSQAFYEDRVTDVLRVQARFASAESIFELGCGTGRFALRLLTENLSPRAGYRGVDVSPTMVRLAQQRLAPYSPRAEVLLTEGGAPLEEPAAAYDRFVSNFVFDLLSAADIQAVLREAHRMLRPGGLLCLTSLSSGVGPASRAVARLWSWVHTLQPVVVGGCRPIDLLPFLSKSDWEVRHLAKVVKFGIASEVVVAQRN